MPFNDQDDLSILSSPPEDSRCTEVLTDTLEGYAGIREAAFDVNTAQLSVRYDPRLITPERALMLVQRAGRQAGARAMQCAAKGDAACASCVAAMEKNLIQHYQQVASLQLAPTAFQNGVMEISLTDTSVQGTSTVQIESAPAEAEKEQKSRLLWDRRQLEIIFTATTLLATILAFIGQRIGMNAGLEAVLMGIAFVFGGVFGLIDGYRAAKEEHKLDVNLLMIFAALGAAIIGKPFEGAVLLFLFSLSNTLQSFALERNRQAIARLLDLRPPVANVRRGSRLVVLPVEKLVIGDVVLVRPGERFPIDGEVISGSSDVNQATITGESIPVHKTTGDAIFASTVNGNGALEVRVTRLAKDTTLARIVQMVEEAQNSKARTQSALDSFEMIYAWFVLGGAVLLTLIPYFFMGEAFYPTFYRAMTWLVVASPCALVISTPASILSAIANGARNGILFKGGIHLEKTAGIKVVAFDKTGTLTSGTPSLMELVPANGVAENEILSLVAAAEARSEHPIGKALLKAAHDRGLNIPNATEFRAIPGQGIEANVDQSPVWVGNRRMFSERGVIIPHEMEEQMRQMEENGQTVMLAYTAGRWLGLLGVADTLRQDAPEIIRRLKAAGIDRVVMLTGDNERVAQSIAREAGVDEVQAGLLPQDKVRVLESLRKQYGDIAMIGDGVNDAPALATADVGIAMGGAGSDVALETADLVLMSDDLSNLPHAIHLARHARKIIWQNLTFALAVIVLLVVSAFGLNLPLPLGVVGHEGSTVLVVLNGLRLLGMRKL